MKPVRSKYGNIKKEVDGINFDSTVESDYYKFLKGEKMYGRIKDFKVQQVFVLQDSYKLDGQERTQQAIKYIADFVVCNNDGTIEIIDVKGGMVTPEFAIKKKLFESKFRRRIWLVRKKSGKWVKE